MSWKDVFTPADADDILDSMAETTRLPRADIDALMERANPHWLRDRLLEHQWVGHLAWTSSELLTNVTIHAARFCLTDPIWIHLHGTIADMWDRYKKSSKWDMWSKTNVDPLDKAQRETFREFCEQLNSFRELFSEDERCAISLMRHVRCHPYQDKWVPKIKNKAIHDRVTSRSMETKPTTAVAWAAFDAFLAKYGDEEKAVINVAVRIWAPAADLLVALDAYHLASLQVAERDKRVRDARTG